MCVRPARPEDLPLLADVERSAGELFRAARLRSSLDFAHTVRLDLLRRAQADGTLWIATGAGDAPVGFVVFSRVGDTAFVDELSVAREAQGRGLGRALMGAAIDVARRRGCRAVTLTTFRDVPWNRPFYEKIGFRMLPEPELPPDLAAILADEASRGLLPDERCAMELRL